MEAMEAILSRRSVRQYTREPVSDEVIGQLLQAAMAAPSAGNEQTWEFVVLTDRALLNEMALVHPHAQMIVQAPLAVLVCGDTNREMYRGYWVQDCSAATQNLLLAAKAVGLGAVWTGIHPDVERVHAFREKFALPDNVIPLALVVIGTPAEDPPPSDRFDPTRVHRNGW